MSKKIDKKLIIKSLKNFYSLKSDKQLAEFLGIATTTLSSWISRNSIDWDLIFAKCVDIDFDKLIREGRAIAIDKVENKIERSPSNCDFIDMIDKKDKKLLEMSEEIGFLKKEIEFLKKGGSFASYKYVAEP